MSASMHLTMLQLADRVGVSRRMARRKEGSHG